jgi:hypothetical protein
MLHDVCLSQTPIRTRNPLFRHRLHVSVQLNNNIKLIKKLFYSSLIK